MEFRPGDWSPDGKFLVVGIMENGVRVLSLVNVESSNVLPLPILPGGLGPTQTATLGRYCPLFTGQKMAICKRGKEPDRKHATPLRISGR